MSAALVMLWINCGFLAAILAWRDADEAYRGPGRVMSLGKFIMTVVAGQAAGPLALVAWAVLRRRSRL